MQNPEVYKASMKEIASVVIKSPAWTTTLASRPPNKYPKKPGEVFVSGVFVSDNVRFLV